MTALERAAKVAGSLAKLGTLIGVSPSTPGNWKHEGRPIPPEHCVAIEKATGVTRQDLRPDDWQAIWPELVPSKKPAVIKSDRRKPTDNPVSLTYEGVEVAAPPPGKA